MKPVKYQHYYKKGQVERAASSGRIRYVWKQGYATVKSGFAQWTRYEAMHQAESEGAMAKFHNDREQAIKAEQA